MRRILISEAGEVELKNAFREIPHSQASEEQVVLLLVGKVALFSSWSSAFQ